jgi:hypothetical protein
MPGRYGGLLVSRRPEPDESLMGLILRWTEVNCYETSSWILEMAGLGRKRLHMGCTFLFDGEFDVANLARLARLEPHELIPMTYPPAGGSGSAYRSLFCGSPVPKYVIRLRRPKICPGCLSDSAYCRKIWDLALVSACPIHGCLLLDECPRCKRPITWVRNRVCVCPCGSDWRVAAPIQMEDWELCVARRVHELCGLRLQSAAVNRSANTNPLLSLDLEGLISALFFIVGQYVGNTDTKGKFIVPSRRNGEIHSLINKASLVFENWPENFCSFLDWRRTLKKNAKYVGGLRKEFTEYQDTLYEQLSSDRFDFIRIAFEEYLSTRWDGGYVSAIKRLNRQSPRKRYVSRLVAATQLRTDFLKIDKLINSGKLNAIIYNEGRKRRILIEAESVEKLKRELKEQVGLQEAARLLNVSTKLVLDMVRYGCIKSLRGPGVDGYKLWKFSRLEIDALLAHIAEKIDEPPTSTAKSEAINFAKALLILRRRTSLGTGHFVRAILDGVISPYAKTKKVGLHSFQFLKKTLSDYAVSLMSGHIYKPASRSSRD